MQELPDDQLDGLFRKSLEESEPPYDPVAWRAMQDKLAAYDRQQFWQRWFRRSLPVVLLLLLSTGVWLLTNRNRVVPAVAPTTTSDSRIATAVQAKKKAGLGNEKHPDPLNRLAAPPTTGSALTKSEKPSPDQPELAETAVAMPATGSSKTQNRSVADDAISSVPSSAQRVPVIRVRKSTAGQRFSPGRQPEVAYRVVRRVAGTPKQTAYFYAEPHARTAKSTFTDQSPDRVERKGYGQVASQLPDVTPPDRFADAVALLSTPAIMRISKPALIDRTIAAPALPDTEAQRVASVVDKTTGLSVRALIAPDLSTIGLTNFSRPGTNGGLMLEYQYHRWRIQAGILRSIKVYQANESMYESKATSQWDVAPSSIDGRCNMLDIPINLRYDLALIPRRNPLPPSRWFVSGGTTTYYMLREDYTYNYDNPADPKIKYRDWTTETGRYGFSQLNVSAGYERALTPRLFWQVEPFLKVPLRGVGFYKVNLLSTGAFFSLRYKL